MFSRLIRKWENVGVFSSCNRLKNEKLPFLLSEMLLSCYRIIYSSQEDCAKKIFISWYMFGSFLFSKNTLVYYITYLYIIGLENVGLSSSNTCLPYY